MKNLKSYRVYLMVGYPGSGKSTLARKMAELLPAYYLSSDEVRQKIFNSTRYDPVGDQTVAPQRDRVYEMMGEMVLEKLKKHQKVVLDATNLETAKREQILSALSQKLTSDQLCFVCVKTPYKTIKVWFTELDKDSPTEGESLLAGWQRVYAIFKQKKQEGAISWPTNKDIKVISAKTMYDYLD